MRPRIEPFAKPPRCVWRCVRTGDAARGEPAFMRLVAQSLLEWGIFVHACPLPQVARVGIAPGRLDCDEGDCVTDTLAISATGLVKRFGDRRVVDGVDIAVPKGAIYGVLGPNGAGKTTTLRMLLGIIEPDEGSRTLLDHARPREVSDRVGYLPEERGLYPAMKAREAIAFMGALRGLDWREGRKRADTLLAAAGLGHATHQKIRKLSKGMAQLVQLLGSVVHQPDLLVLDEPFSGLDPVNQERLEKLILAERDRGATILFSTHIMSHAERLCDRLAIIAGGKRRFEGTVAEARGTLPQRVHYVPHHAGQGLEAMLPRDAVRENGGWAFGMPDAGVEALLMTLIEAGHGIAGLSIERPGLHDAFVEIVGRQALEAAA